MCLEDNLDINYNSTYHNNTRNKTETIPINSPAIPNKVTFIYVQWFQSIAVVQ